MVKAETRVTQNRSTSQYDDTTRSKLYGLSYRIHFGLSKEHLPDVSRHFTSENYDIYSFREVHDVCKVIVFWKYQFGAEAVFCAVFPAISNLLQINSTCPCRDKQADDEEACVCWIKTIQHSLPCDTIFTLVHFQNRITRFRS